MNPFKTITHALDTAGIPYRIREHALSRAEHALDEGHEHQARGEHRDADRGRQLGLKLGEKSAIGRDGAHPDP